jgi:XTP/dITP diphosphohydrolase
MTRRGPLLIASHNAGKAAEIRDLLEPHGFEIVSAASLGLPEPDETETTYAGNAVLKAEAACNAANMLTLADDSGLSVSALGGAPGIYSARWAGPSKDFAAAMARVQGELGGAADRSARFVCALALAAPGAPTQVFEGFVEGTIVWPPRGTLGFGYDPIFVPDGFGCTLGEMPPQQKLPLTHRARAFEKLIAALT